ncbi:TIR domain-containing protein [Streptomyces naganishii]|uniref:TIR domain-containing protein n=1 Tax=Streptomyces naganishii TaxID=285447 RepID=UPI00167CB8DE|nr:TIR domain-containing protein [Streptomyces naganishii]
MKIFLSWSGPASQKCAELLASWLPYFSDEIEPFVSSESIRKGARGLTELKEQLDQSSFGIACITRANIDAPWITFESGALSKEVDEHRGLVVPFLLEGTHKDLELANSPLRQFSSTQADDPADVLKMVKAISAVLRESANRPPDDIRVKNLFDMVWPMLRDGLAAIDLTADRAEQDPPRRSPEEMLEELTLLVHEQISRITDLERAVTSLRGDHTEQPRKRPRFTNVYDDSMRLNPLPGEGSASDPG